MNLSRIKAVCAGGKRATIMRFMAVEWISNGKAAYRVRGVEIGSPEALMELWNLSEKARAKALIQEEETRDLRFRSVVEYEEELKLLGTAGLSEEGCYVALLSDRGVLWIDADWLNPLRLDHARYFARWRDDDPLIAVYEDLTDPEALILPVGSALADEISRAAKDMAAQAFHWLTAEADEEAARLLDEMKEA